MLMMIAFFSPSCHKIKCLVTLRKMDSHGWRKKLWPLFSSFLTSTRGDNNKTRVDEMKKSRQGDENVQCHWEKLLLCIARDEHQFHPFP
jgi:hypothetical protein